MHQKSVDSLTQVHWSGDYLSHRELLKALMRNSRVEYRHAGFLFEGGQWQGTIWSPLECVTPTPEVLVIGQSDLVITPEIIRKVKAHGIGKVYATNLSKEAALIPGSHDLPLGIPDRDRGSRIHRIQSSRLALRLGWRSSRRHLPRPFRGALASFSTYTNNIERTRIVEIVELYSHLHRGQFHLSRRGRLADFERIGYWGLNLCPRGNGPDTHRVWETLLMGSYPVVLSGEHVTRLLKSLRLPYVSVETWDELEDVERLKSEFEALEEGTWDYQALTNKFWIDTVLDVSP